LLQPTYSKPNKKTFSLSGEAPTGNQSWSKLEMMGTVLLSFILLVVVMRVFFPPDVWLYGRGNDISVQDLPVDMPITQFVLRLTYLTAICLTLKNWRGNLGEVKYTLLILAQLIGFSSSIFWSEDPTQSFKDSCDMLTIYLLLLHILHRYTIAQFVTLLTRLFGISAICCIMVVIFLPSLAYNLNGAGYEHTIRGAFVQKNGCGEVCSLAVLTATYSWYTRANSRIFAGFVIVANVLLLFASDSVTSILTTVVGMMIYGTAYISRSFTGKILLLTLAMGTGILAIAVVTNVDSLAALVGRNAGLTGRAPLWHVIDGLIALRPFHGYGLGFWIFKNHDDNNIWLAVDWGAPEAHNDVRDVLLQTGIVGLTFYVINNFTSLFLGFRRFGKLEDGSIFCLVIIVVFFYRSFTETAVVGTSARAALFLYIAQAYLYKLSFARQSDTNSAVQPSNQRRGVRATSSAIS